MHRGIFEKPKYGVELISGHSLTFRLKMALLLNEGGGNYIWDSVSKKSFDFDSSYRPIWSNDGVAFTGNRIHINTLPLNSVLQASASGTVLFGYKYLSTPTVYYIFKTGESTIFNFALTWDSAGSGITIWINDIAVGYFTTPTNYQTGKVLGFSWYSSGGNIYVNLYKDGAYLGQTNQTATFPNSTDVINIGARTDSDGRYAGGVINWFNIWDRTLSDGEIKSISANPYQIYQRFKMDYMSFDFPLLAGKSLYEGMSCF